MKPVDFEGSNENYGAPDGLDEKTVGALPVYKHTIDLPAVVDRAGDIQENKVNAILSCWEITDEDLEVITRTRRIWHSTWTDEGFTLYPFSIFACDPKKQQNDIDTSRIHSAHTPQDAPSDANGGPQAPHEGS